jgi:hypothetical protein
MISLIRENEMFSSCSPMSAFVAGVKIGAGNLLAFLSPAGSATPQTRAREIAAHDRLNRKRFQSFYEHRAPEHLRFLSLGDHTFRRIARQVIGHDPFQLLEPEQRHLREQCALAWNGLVHDHVEGADAIARDHQQTVRANGVVIPNFAASEQRQGSNGRCMQ